MPDPPTVWVPADPAQVGLDRLERVAAFERYRPPAVPPELAAGDLLVTPYAEPELARETVARLPPGALVQALESGVDSLRPAIPDGVALHNARGVHDGPVAEWVLAAILGSLKRLSAFRDSQVDGAWRRVMPEQLSGRTVLLVGYGAIGRAVERRLEPFGVDVLRVSRRAGAGVAASDELPSLLPRAQIVVLLTPLTDATHSLWSAPNLVITPHVASDTPDVLERLYRFVHEQARRLAAGAPLENAVA